jgi:hypothetical protein
VVCLFVCTVYYSDEEEESDEQVRSRQDSADSLMADELHLSEVAAPPLLPRQSLDLTCTSPVVLDHTQSADEEDVAPPPEEEEEEEEEEDILDSDLAAVEEQMGLAGKSRGYNSHLSADDDDEEEEEEEGEDVVDGSDVFVEMVDATTGKRVGGSSVSDHTASKQSKVSKGSHLFSMGGQGNSRRK